MNEIKDGLYYGKKEKKESKRKTITIQKSEWKKWQEIKQNQTWTSLMREARKALKEVEELRDVLKQAVINRVPTTPKTGIKRIRKPPPKLNVRSKGVQAQFLKEFKSLNLDGENGFKKILKPMSEEELSKIQKDEEELKEKSEQFFKKAELKDLNPPT